VTFEAALTIELKTITALNNRVYPFTSTEEKFSTATPYLIFKTSEGLRTKSMGEGYQQGKTVVGELNVIAPRYDDMKSVTKSVIDKIVSMEQRSIGTGGPYIQELTYEQPVELYEDKPKLYRCVMDFEVYF
jgi:hypothetical protein